MMWGNQPQKDQLTTCQQQQLGQFVKIGTSTFAAAGAAGLMTAPQGFCMSPALLHTPGSLGELQGILLGSSWHTLTLLFGVSGTTW
jgi:hypothetical protein